MEPRESQFSPIFTACFENTVGFEGGFYNNPKDPGGPTKYGIAWNFNKTWYTSLDMNRDTVVDLPLDLAMERYHDKYWVACKADRLGMFAMETLKSYFDMCIHAGPSASQKCLQKSLNHLLVGEENDLVVDGNVGTKTIQTFFSFLSKSYDPDDEVNDHNFCSIFNSVRAEMYLSFYNNPNSKSWYKNLRFLNSSLRRL